MNFLAKKDTACCLVMGRNCSPIGRFLSMIWKVVKKIAIIILGNDNEPSEYTEQEVLDLERHGFVNVILCN